MYTGAPNHPSLLAAVGAINSFVVDGSPANTTEDNVDGTSAMTGRWPVFLPPEDMVDEFKVATATYNAADGYNFNLQTVIDNLLTQGIDLASLGFSPALDQLVPPAYRTFPKMSVDVMTALGGGAFDYSATNYHVMGSERSWIHGAHTVHAGIDFRLFRGDSYTYSGPTPALTFGNTWTRGPLDNSPVAPVGQGLASFLLGLPTSGTATINPSSAIQSWYIGGYVQDDWRVTSRLSVNLGVRFEHESPITERYNRSIASFDFSDASPISAKAIAAYAQNPIPQIPPSQFRVEGGATFVGVGGRPRGLWSTDAVNVAPRVGIAYTLNPKTVVRAGYGLYYLPQGADVNSVRQAGFSQSTALNASVNNGLSFIASLANPSPADTSSRWAVPAAWAPTSAVP